MEAIPPELLIEIFLFARGLQVQELHLHSSRCPAWSLSHVSRRFRALALSLPFLWSNIHISPGLCSRLHDPVSILKTTLTRSGDRIRFSWRVGVNERHQALMQSMFHVLTSSAENWIAADIEVTSDVLPGLACIRGRLPRLEELSVACYDSGVRCIEAFEDAPMLCKVTIRGMEHGARFVFPTDQIRTFKDGRLSGLGRSEVEMMKRLERLESISWRLHPVPEADLVLSALKTMSVCDSVFTSPGMVVAPQLEELSVRLSWFGHDSLSYPSPGIVRMIQASGCSHSLRSLSLSLDPYINSVLEVSPNLETFSLRVSGREHNDVLATAFRRMVDAREMFIPVLKIMSITQCDSDASLFFDEREDETLADALMNVLATKKSLDRFIVEVWTSSVRKVQGISETQRQRLDGLREGGLELSVRANDFGSCRIFI